MGIYCNPTSNVILKANFFYQIMFATGVATVFTTGPKGAGGP